MTTRRSKTLKPKRGRTTRATASRRTAAAADLRKQLDRRTRELAKAQKLLTESLRQQTATANVLKVISRSAFDLQPALNTLVASARELCNASMGVFYLGQGDLFHLATEIGAPPAFAQYLRDNPVSPNRSTGAGRAALSGKVEHVPDVLADPDYQYGQHLGGYRSLIAVPLLLGGEVIGVFTLSRFVAEAFTPRQIELVTTFADQAVIAIQNARLFDEVRARTSELSESLQQQTATADVLKVISRSAVDLQTVLQTLVDSAANLCEAESAQIFRCSNTIYKLAACRGYSREYEEHMKLRQFEPGRDSIIGRIALEHRLVHVPDVLADPEYNQPEAQRLGRWRTALGVPLMREGTPIGGFTLTRSVVKPFTEKQIELVATFADQAVIAIENSRLFDEVRAKTRDLEKSLEQQTATADVLKVISRSTVDLKTVLETLCETVARLCRADQTPLYRRRDDDKHHLVAAWGMSEEARQFALAHPLSSGRGTLTGRVILERRAIHMPDVLQDPEYTYGDGQKTIGYRTLLGIPLLREDDLLGVFAISRTRVEPFTDKEIELATTFADQAVIAIENARLFEELRHRQAELARSVDELTATGDVLKTISRSSVDLETVLDTLVETVMRLCRADNAAMFRRIDGEHHLVASCGISEQAKEFFRTHPVARGRGTMSGRVELERRAVHIPDVLQDREYTFREGQKVVGYRTLLGIPLLRGDELVGHFNIDRTRVEPFTNKEIELATTFADQAVIAIENARLFDELRERQAELRVTFDNMGDGVAMFGANTHLAAWNRNLQEMLDLPNGLLAGRPSFAELFRYLAERGEFGSADLEAELSRSLEDTSREMRYERTRPDGRVIEVRRNPVPGGGFVLIYADVTERKRAEEAIRAARDAAERALRELQAAQASLVHAQKMAALGQVTAGIAHEIKNPLNFVNNFADLSVELLDELKDAAARSLGAPDSGNRAEIAEIVGMLTGNLEKIIEHGRRADGIVRSMLQHSRGSSDDWQSTDLNALVEEALNLAYHGARAQDPNFDIALQHDLDRSLAPVEVVPQELTRVLLNLIGNGFYAVDKRSREGDGTFRPALKVTTREFGESVEVRVWDNGIGILPENRDKLFQPFFTTKPTGEGTGLGLSISYEIITQQHGGTITVESEVDDFTEFMVRLPRRRAGAG